MKIPATGAVDKPAAKPKRASTASAATKKRRTPARSAKTAAVIDGVDENTVGLNGSDTRELATLTEMVAEKVRKVPVLPLRSADFRFLDLCGHRLGVERKEVNDLLGSLATPQNDTVHLIDQLRRMVEDYDHSLILVEGSLRMNPLTRKAITRRQTGWSYLSVVMMLWSIETSRDDISVLWTADQSTTVEVLRGLHNRALRGCVLPNQESNPE